MSTDDVVLPPVKPVDSKTVRTTETHEIALLMQKILGDDSLSKLNDKHIDEILSQRRQVNEYIHKERMQNHEKFKIASRDDLIRFLVILGFLCLTGAVIIFFKPEYIEKFLLIILALFGGFGIKDFIKPQGKSRQD